MFESPKKRRGRVPKLFVELDKNTRSALEDLCKEWNINFTEFVIYSILVQHENRDLINAIHEKKGYDAKTIMDLGYKQVYKYYFGARSPQSK